MGLTDGPLSMAAIEQGEVPPSRGRAASTAVGYARAIGLEEGDVLTLELTGASGASLARYTTPPLDRNKDQYMMFAGARRPPGGGPGGGRPPRRPGAGAAQSWPTGGSEPRFESYGGDDAGRRGGRAVRVAGSRPAGLRVVSVGRIRQAVAGLAQHGGIEFTSWVIRTAAALSLQSSATLAATVPLCA